MYLEALAIYAIFLFIMFLFAEVTKKPVIGLLGALLLFPLGMWLIADDLQVTSGTVMSYSENRGEARFYNGTMDGLSTDTSNITTTMLTNYNETGTGTITATGVQNTTLLRANLAMPAYVPFSFGASVGLVLLCMAFILSWHYISIVSFGKSL